jgi:hypothetical protein
LAVLETGSLLVGDEAAVLIAIQANEAKPATAAR